MKIIMSEKIKKDVLSMLKNAVERFPQGLTAPFLHEIAFNKKYHLCSVQKSLQEMEAEGILKSTTARSRHGRPLKLYTIKENVMPTTKFAPYVKQAIKRWDKEFPASPQSIKTRHMLINDCLNILTTKCGASVRPEQLSVDQAQGLYDHAIENGCGPSGASNKMRAMRKLLYYLGIKDDKNPFHLALKSQAIIKNLPVIKRTSAGRKSVIKNREKCSHHVLEEILAGIEVMCKEPENYDGVGPTQLHKELFNKNWDVSHTLRGCQVLQKHGLITYGSKTKGGKGRKFYIPTGKRFFQAVDHQENQLDPPATSTKSPLVRREDCPTHRQKEQDDTSPTISNQVNQAVNALNWLANRVIQLEDELNTIRKALSMATAQARRAMIQYGD